METCTLITGASSGIGLELSRIAVRKHNNVLLVARDEVQLGKLRKQLLKEFKSKPVRIEILSVDLSKPGAAKQVFDYCAKKRFVVDQLINNAGFGEFGTFDAIDRQRQIDMITLNCTALTELTHYFLPQLKAHASARILNLGSVASFFPGPLMATYFATKAYVLSFSEALAEELRGTNVTVTCLCPGPTKSKFAEQSHVSKQSSIATTKVTAREVAEFGWWHMEHGTTAAVHGRMNRLLVKIPRLLPRSLVARIVKKTQR